MSFSIEATAGSAHSDASLSLLKRVGVLSYGVLSYTIGMGGLLWIILAMGGLAPVGLSSLQTENIFLALACNVALVILFGVQHSVMARSGFKERLQKLFPPAMERSTFVLLSGIFMIAAICMWQPLPGQVWAVQNTLAQYALWSAYALGWAYLVLATFITNHFELMGLRQVYLYFVGKPYRELPFTNKFMYKYSRHPMMLGILVGMWSVPVMSLSHFIMSTLLTVYIVVGVLLEERDLVDRFGETYREYKKQIATFIPGLF